jgi:hypothetical protein
MEGRSSAFLTSKPISIQFKKRLGSLNCSDTHMVIMTLSTLGIRTTITRYDSHSRGTRSNPSMELISIRVFVVFLRSYRAESVEYLIVDVCFRSHSFRFFFTYYGLVPLTRSYSEL